MYDLRRMRALKDKAAIVGIGETDYGKDYRSAQGAAKAKGSVGELDSMGLAIKAALRALDDAGLKREDIDGVSTGGPVSAERLCEMMGLDPLWAMSGDAARSIYGAVQAISNGLCDTVLCMYGNAQRSMNTQYGGPQAMGGDAILSYVYYAPWGFTSQGALYSMMFKRHQIVYGTTSEQLAAIPVAFRKHACMNPNAVMQTPLTKEDYLNSRFIVEPLHIYDYCLINDGGVAFIVTRADKAKDLKQHPVLISGIGSAEMNSHATELRPRMIDFYHPVHTSVAKQVYSMAGVTPKDIDTYATYDSFSVHLLFSLEGFGFCKVGEIGDWMQNGRIELGGELPCNTSGGMLSESYMQSWNHQPELVRQLRHQNGNRQVQGAEVAQYVGDAGGKCVSLIYRRG